MKNMKLWCCCAMVAVLVGGCRRHSETDTVASPHERAVRLTHQYGIIDTHIDAPGRLHDSLADVSRRSSIGEFDYERAREGGLQIPFMSIYTPSNLEGTGKSKPLADTLIDIVEGLVRRSPDKFVLVKSVDDVGRYAGSGKVLLAMGMENGSPLEGNLDNLRHFYGRGIRYVTLAHAKWNHLCDASFDRERHWNGLSPFGREVVGAMNRLGIMVDISHLTDSAATQVLRLSKAPVIASHSSCRFFTPGFERNMSDTLIKQLAAASGVIQINFGSYFLSAEATRQGDEQEQRFLEYLREHHVGPGDSLAQQFMEQYRHEHPLVRGTVADVADHVDHVVKLVGVDYVGIGSDFEGVGTLPVGLEDVSRYPNLIEELLKRSYTDEMIRKICSGNLLRVWSAVERIAQQEGQR
jgi:membrane dipeptidase